MHQKKIVHRDLKLDNVLINQIVETGALNVKIADFGLSTFISSNPREKLFEKCGTPCYAAPELLKGTGYTSKCDIFSLGSILFNLITGRYLFPGTERQEVLRCNMKCDLEWTHEFLTEFSPSCKSLLMSMLDIDPGKRPSAK